MLRTSFFVKRPQKPKVYHPGRISKSLQKSQLSTKTFRLPKTVLFALSENGSNIAFAIRDGFVFLLRFVYLHVLPHLLQRPQRQQPPQVRTSFKSEASKL